MSFNAIQFYGMNKVSGYTPTDVDAIAFLTAAGITDETISEAIDTFVIDMKANSLWTKFYAIYPMVGGTDATHKWNLKDPRDLDAAYRITWSGTITHNSNGVQGNGSNGYGNTHLVEESVMTRNNKALSVYSRTNSSGVFASVGTYTSSPGITTVMYLRDGATTATFRINDGGGGNSNSDSSGFFISSRVSSTQRITYRNGSSLGTVSATTNATSMPYKFYLMAMNWGNSSNTPIQFSPRNYCYFAFSTGFTSGEASTYNTLVQSLQTSLGRNV